MTPPGQRELLAARERLVDYAFGVGWALTRHSPEPVTARLMESAADRVWRRRGRGVQQLEANLARAVPDADADALRAVSRRALASYFRYWHEALRLPAWSTQRIIDTVTTSNEPPVREVFARGRGAVLALPHMANWDLAGAWATLTGMPVATVAERLRPEGLYRRFVAYRAEIGIEVVPLTGDSNPLAAMREALERGRLVCLLADRSFGPGGVEVELLGEPAHLPGGPAALARMGRTPLFVVTPRYVGAGLHLAVGEPIEPVSGSAGVATMMQRVADGFSAAIREHPQDWHMLQRTFDADRAAPVS